MEAQSGIVDTAAVEALNGDGTALVLVDMFEGLDLLKRSSDETCYVTGDLVANVNGILKLLCYSARACVDAASITNSWMHLVMSNPVLV